MGVHHRVDVRPRPVDFGMDEAFRIDRPVVLADDLAVHAECHDVGCFHQPRRARPRHQEALGVARIAPADVAVAVDDALVVEDAVADDEIVDHRLQVGVYFSAPCRRTSCSSSPYRRSRVVVSSKSHAALVAVLLMISADISLHDVSVIQRAQAKRDQRRGWARFADLLEDALRLEREVGVVERARRVAERRRNASARCLAAGHDFDLGRKVGRK